MLWQLILFGLALSFLYVYCFIPLVKAIVLSFLSWNRISVVAPVLIKGSFACLSLCFTFLEEKNYLKFHKWIQVHKKQYSVRVAALGLVNACESMGFSCFGFLFEPVLSKIPPWPVLVLQKFHFPRSYWQTGSVWAPRRKNQFSRWGEIVLLQMRL